MAEETIFSKIIRGEIPADIVFQDDTVTAFRDISPQAPTHILIIPNKLIPTVNDVTAQDEQVLGHLFVVAAKIAQQEGIAEEGYRLVMNCNKHGGQEV
ncbi:HIT domain-containing protein, partial [Vibrio parahaemolyticus]